MSVRIAPLAAAGLLALAGINAWLATIVLEGAVAGDAAVVGSVEWSPKLSPSTDAMPNPKPINAYGQTLAHPIFFKTREPFVPAPRPAAVAPNAAPAPVVDPGLILGGVLITPDLKKAYLSSRADPRGTWVSEGESFMGWTVASIDEAGVKLQQQGRTIALQLYAAQ